MKYYIIAGERSGDLHGSNLIKALKNNDPSAEIRCWGGDYMKKAGGELVVHYKELAVMGFAEVLKSINKISGYIRHCKKDLEDWKPDVVILIDFAGFNLRIAKFAKEKGFKVFYYISPKIWAWQQSRVHKVKAYVDKMFVILPFEKDFYKKHNVDVEYVGNPLMDAIRDFNPNPFFKKDNKIGSKPLIAILPGSRKQELEKLLKIYIKAADYFPEYEFAVAGVDNLSDELYSVAKQKGIKVIYNQTYDLLSQAHAAIVTSGTATLETALFEVPQVVCYKTSALTYAVGKALVKIDFFSLPNLIADKEVVKEMLQKEVTPERLANELKKVVHGGFKREVQLADYKKIKDLLGRTSASEKTARIMIELTLKRRA